jgi:hypothetical protein
VHSIPTEPGHPPPFRQMYRLSPSEYRELEKRVTAFLKAGILEVSTSPRLHMVHLFCLFQSLMAGV